MKLHIKTEIRKVSGAKPLVTLEVHAARPSDIADYLNSMQLAMLAVSPPTRLASPVVRPPRLLGKKGGRR